MLDQVEEEGLDIVSLDEAARRLKEGERRRFVCFTFDDGYRDNLAYAYPLFKRRSLPLTIYVPTDYPSERGELWWLTEEVVARAEEIELCRNSELWRLPTGTVQEKGRSHDQIYWWLRSVDEPTQRRIVRTLADRYEIDTAALCRDLVMNWDEIRTLAADPLVTIGAHTKGHYAIAKLCAEEAIEEVRGGADVLERDFALAKELGFKTAVTTRKGVLFPAHKRYLTALPRVSLKGEYQSQTYTALYLTGAPFALWNRFQQVSAA